MTFADDDVAELYDLTNPWNYETDQDKFFTDLVLAAESVLDVGCGTGLLLHEARRRGHTGRLAGIDPDVASLRRARRRVEDAEWVEGRAVDIAWRGEFELATMTSHAFQCLITDEEVRTSLTAIRGALRDGGRFTFDTRHPQAKAWEQWVVGDSGDIPFTDGRVLRMSSRAAVHGDVVDMVEVTALADGTVLREDSASLRFLNPEALNTFLTEAGFEVREQYGDWERGPVTAESREIVTVAYAR